MLSTRPGEKNFLGYGLASVASVVGGTGSLSRFFIAIRDDFEQNNV